ncbi:hypothetical protein [Mucilaginibacter sp. OK283]|uniref:exodeoxyribonuclease X C-terminal domain-containing protein n=1 Tax=Mucilaginibacter sp. OK283 TaxID=1881049 RepID=UPI000B892A8C|nr:hypothetical protein [Mucilaginibacter sp. OK283]
MKFGKHKGKTIKDVAEGDVFYIDWNLRENDSFTIDYEVEKYIEELKGVGKSPGLSVYGKMRIDDKFNSMDADESGLIV